MWLMLNIKYLNISDRMTKLVLLWKRMIKLRDKEIHDQTENNERRSMTSSTFYFCLYLTPYG